MALILRPILGSTKPFRVANGGLEVWNGSEYEGVVSASESSMAAILEGIEDLVVSEDDIKTYLKALGYDKILNQWIINDLHSYWAPKLKFIPEGIMYLVSNYTTGVDSIDINDETGEVSVYFDSNTKDIPSNIQFNETTGELSGAYDSDHMALYDCKFIQHYLKNTYPEETPKYMIRMGAFSCEFKDRAGDDEDNDLQERFALLSNAVDALEEIAIEMEPLNIRGIDPQGATSLLRPSHVSDYVSLDHMVEESGYGEPIVLSLEKIYYEYNALMYADDANIITKDGENMDEWIKPADEIIHEGGTDIEARYLVYEQDEVNKTYEPIAKTNDLLELFIQYDNGSYVNNIRSLVVVDQVEVTENGFTEISPIIMMINNLFKVEVTRKSIVIYPINNSIKQYRLLKARLLTPKTE